MKKTNNTTNILIGNININSFGNENLDYITEEYLTKLIKNGPRGSIQKLLKQIFFNPNHPENQTVKITNRKEPYVKIMKCNKWEFQDKEEVVDSMVNKGYNIIDEHYDEIQNALDNRYKSKYKEFKGDYENKNLNLMKKIKKETELVIINGS